MLKNMGTFFEGLLDSEHVGKPGWHSPRNMTEMISYVLSDIMGDITFSRNWETQKSTTNRHILKLLTQGTMGINTCGHMPALLRLKLDKVVPSLTRGVYQFEALSKAQSDWRAAQGHSLKQRDIFAGLLEARDPETGRGYSQQDLVAEAGILIVAGSDTTATTLTATLFYLLHYPAALEEVQREVKENFGSLEEIRIGPQLTACRYLYACIDEAMRLSPPVGGVLPREIMKGGVTVDGHHFPAGIDIGVPTYTIHHNETYYPDPFAFKPERWIPDPTMSKESLEISQSAFCPFGVGRTSCVGKYLAYQEMGIMVARLVWQFDMRVQPDSTLGEGKPGLGWGRQRKNEFQLYDAFVSTHEGPLVEFRPRI